MYSKKKVILKQDHYWKGMKIQIYPTDDQKAYLDEQFDLNRYIYNWAITTQQKNFEEYKLGNSEVSYIDLDTMINKLSDLLHDETKSWLRSITITSARYQVINADNAYKFFFNNINNKPKTKDKKKCKAMSFPTRPERMYFRDTMLKIDGLKSMIETKWHSGWYGHYKGYGGKIIGIPKFNNSYIKRNNLGEYFISFSYQEPVIKEGIEFFDKSGVIGIDLNVKDRFVCSNGYRSGSPNIEKLEHRKNIKRSKCSNDIERKSKWEKANPGKDYVESNRAKKRHYEYAKAEKKLADTVETFIQTETKKIVQMSPKIVVMEGMNVEDLKKYHKVAQQLQHANFGRCREVMKKKCEKHDITFIEADRNYPSSQLCSRCGSIHKTGGKNYICPNCGLIIDRDDNAALNLQKYAFKL